MLSTSAASAATSKPQSRDLRVTMASLRSIVQARNPMENTETPTSSTRTTTSAPVGGGFAGCG